MKRASAPLHFFTDAARPDGAEILDDMTHVLLHEAASDQWFSGDNCFGKRLVVVDNAVLQRFARG